jgi:5,10-methylenetetrahydromethanopterin reductase
VVELWTIRIPEVGTAAAQAERAEAAGWDGIAFTDSQNLVGDPFVAIAVASKASDTLRFATGVTNAATRDPAALATGAATVQEETGGRFVLGIGRGDTALFHLGRKPMPVADFTARVDQLQGYLAGGTVDRDGYPSRLRWLDRARQPKVPVSIAASGPKVISYAARSAERVTFALGADPERMAWAIELSRAAATEAGRDPAALSFGAYLTVGCHPDRATARGLISGSVAAFAHFSAMPGSTGAGLTDQDKEVVASIGERYDSNLHLVNAAPHAQDIDAEFVDRFAVIGDSAECVHRLKELVGLGLDHLVLTGPSFGADRDAARIAEHAMRDDVLPALR